METRKPAIRSEGGKGLMGGRGPPLPPLPPVLAQPRMRLGSGVLKPSAPEGKACRGWGEAEEWSGWGGCDAGRLREPRREQARWRDGREGEDREGRKERSRWKRKAEEGGGVPGGAQRRAWVRGPGHRLLVSCEDQPPALGPQLGLPLCCWPSPLPTAASTTATSPSPLRS